MSFGLGLAVFGGCHVIPTQGVASTGPVGGGTGGSPGCGGSGGHGNLSYASRMNRRVVFFLKEDL